MSVLIDWSVCLFLRLLETFLHDGSHDSIHGRPGFFGLGVPLVAKSSLQSEEQSVPYGLKNKQK